MTWTQDGREAAGRETAARWAAARAVAGCDCDERRGNGAVRHARECVWRTWRPLEARSRAGWGLDARAAVAARVRAAWAALGPEERARRLRGLAGGRLGGRTRSAAKAAAARRVWAARRAGMLATSSAQVRVLHERGLWPANSGEKTSKT